jgi:hypothetical protein
VRRHQPAPRRFTSTAPGRTGFADRIQFMARGNFGERLKRERELREVSPNEVVVATRISLRFLEALENEDWDKLPGGVFNRGFVRAIARYLGLDEEHLLAEYDLARGDQSPESSVMPDNRIPKPSKWITAAFAFGAVVILAALVAAGIYGWRRYSAYRRAKPASSYTTPLLPLGKLSATRGVNAWPQFRHPRFLDFADGKLSSILHICSRTFPGKSRLG